MGAQIVQIDLSRPLAPVEIDARHGAIWIVVRWGIRPIGMIRWATRPLGEVLTPDVLRTLLAEQLGLQVLDILRDPALRSPPPAFTPSISVVICTREHPEQLKRQLESCAKLIYPQFEVIAVD